MTISTPEYWYILKYSFNVLSATTHSLELELLVLVGALYDPKANGSCLSGDVC